MKYKNLTTAYSLEILFGLITSLLIILAGPKAIAALAFFGLRPFLLERESLSSKDEYWFQVYQLGKYALFILSAMIIVMYLLNEFILSNGIITRCKEGVIILLPAYVFLHGIIGVINRIKSD